MTTTIYQIYAKIFKKILTLSTTAVVNLINGLFGTNYPPESTVDYNWTEFEDKELKRILADTILTINKCHSYHMEAQMTEDEDIIFRVFEYSYSHADRTRKNDSSGCLLSFPEPKIIYLYSADKAPDEYQLTLDFGSQGTFLYKVSTFKFLETSIEELNQKKMIILIPFQLLKLRKLLEKERSDENLEKLKNLIQNDIIGSIENNLSLGNITMEDAQRLRRLTHKLYQHIYSHYKEMEVLNEMTDESLMLDIDIILKKYEGEIDAKKQALAAQDTLIAEKDAEIAEKDATIADKDATIADKDATIADKDAEIARLKAQLEQLQK